MHPRLDALIDRARARAAQGSLPAIGIVHPCDALALEAAHRIAELKLARPVLIGAGDEIRRAADAAQIAIGGFEVVEPTPAPMAASSGAAAAARATALVHEGGVRALMKGSLHTDELMSAIVHKGTGLRGSTRISHAFVFDLPRYHKLLALADCVVNIAPHLPAKRDILTNAIGLLKQIGVQTPKVGIVAAVETVNPAIAATVDAKALVDEAAAGAWPGAVVEGPFGFDNAISAESARIKKIESHVSGDADLLLMPDLNAGNMLYKSFNYIGGGDCAGLVLGAIAPIVLTSRADSPLSRIASVALSVIASTPAD